MPNINQLKSSKYLSKDDVGQGALLTVRGCEEHNVAREGEAAEMRWCLLFNETEKPLILNSTNGQIIAGFLGSEEMNDWRGRQVVLYHDPTIAYGGKLIGGIRARAPRKPAAPALPQAPPPVAHMPLVNNQPVTPAWPTTPPIGPVAAQVLSRPMLPTDEGDNVPF